MPLGEYINTLIQKILVAFLERPGVEAKLVQLGAQKMEEQLDSMLATPTTPTP